MQSLRDAHAVADAFRVILYWRPLISGLNDSDGHIERAAAISRSAHATVFTGLFYRDVIRDHYKANLLPEPYATTARRKILPQDIESRIVSGFASTHGGPLFRKTSCAVGFAHGEPDFNGHYGIRELCDICPREQVSRCSAA